MEAALNGSAHQKNAYICHCHVLSRKGHCACALTSGLAPIKCIFQYSASVDISSIMHFPWVNITRAAETQSRGSTSYIICISHFRHVEGRPEGLPQRDQTAVANKNAGPHYTSLAAFSSLRMHARDPNLARTLNLNAAAPHICRRSFV